jgi:hypothetical protein
MRNAGLALILSRAIKKGSITITKESFQEAYNLRQRFYRFREFLRSEGEGELALVSDQFKFVVQGRKLIVSFEQILGDTDDNAKSTREINSRRPY